MLILLARLFSVPDNLSFSSHQKAEAISLLKTRMNKILGILFSALLFATIFGGSASAVPAVSSFSKMQTIDIVQASNSRTGAFIGGVAVGTFTGAAIANSNRNCDARGNCHPRRAHRGYRRGYVWDDDCQCWVRPGHHRRAYVPEH